MACQKLFIATKRWISDAVYDRTLKAFDCSLSKSQLDSMDVYTDIKTRCDVYDAWCAMDELLRISIFSISY